MLVEPSVEEAAALGVLCTIRLTSPPSRADRCSPALLFPFSNYVTPSGEVRYCTLLPLSRLITESKQLNVTVEKGFFTITRVHDGRKHTHTGNFIFVIFDMLKCLGAVRKVKTCSDNTEKQIKSWHI